MGMWIDSTSVNKIGDYLESEWTTPSSAMTTAQIAENIDQLTSILNLVINNMIVTQIDAEERHLNNNGFKAPSMDMYKEDDTKLHAGTGNTVTDADTIEVVDFGRSNWGSTGNQIIQ